MADDLTEYALSSSSDKIANEAAEDLTELATSDVLQALESGNTHFVCDNCEEPKESASFRLDPFDEDVFNKEVYRMLCDDCERELRNDI
jgi:hypothetical protein